MCDEWMPALKLDLSIEEFRRLPRNPAYKYEYFGGAAHLTPRPRHYHAVLDLAAAAEPEPDPAGLPLSLRPVRDDDFKELELIFAGTFGAIQPFGSLDDATRKKAARQVLAKTRTGGDGPWVRRASFVARQEDKAVGAILITLLPDGDPCDWDSYYWREPPPDEFVTSGLGRPHLTWIFVSPLLAGHGAGTRLLAAAVRELQALGYRQLLSTFMLGNDSSLLWHWRSGFRLLPYPASPRLIARRLRRHQ
jgi:GNAT superfamily N-acetyltransferase